MKRKLENEFAKGLIGRFSSDPEKRGGSLLHISFKGFEKKYPVADVFSRVSLYSLFSYYKSYTIKDMLSDIGLEKDRSSIAEFFNRYMVKTECYNQGSHETVECNFKGFGEELRILEVVLKDFIKEYDKETIVRDITFSDLEFYDDTRQLYVQNKGIIYNCNRVLLKNYISKEGYISIRWFIERINKNLIDGSFCNVMKWGNFEGYTSTEILRFKCELERLLLHVKEDDKSFGQLEFRGEK